MNKNRGFVPIKRKFDNFYCMGAKTADFYVNLHN